MHTRPPSADPQGAPDRDSAYNVRSVPIRLYLPEGPVLQDLAPPVLEDGGYNNTSLSFVESVFGGASSPRVDALQAGPQVALRGLVCTC
jgi:Autophagy protein Apg5